MTTPYDAGLVVLQGAAVWTAFAGQRTAGGMLAVATALTFSARLQAIVSTGSHTSTDRWFLGMGDGDDTTLMNVFLSSGVVVLLAFVTAVVLLAGMRSWPPLNAAPGTPPLRPAGPAGAVSAVALGVFTLGCLCWIGYTLTQSLGGTYGAPLEALLLGRGLLVGLLGLGTGWAWLTYLPLYAVGALLAATRRVSARGFTLGLALMLLPVALLNMCAYLRTGTLFELGDIAPGAALLGRAQTVVELVGSVVILALMGRRGEPVLPGMPGTPGPVGAPGFGAFGMPGPGAPVPGGYQAAPPPPGYAGHPAPGGYQAPGGHPAPGGYPPPQGGFGPPPTG
ncbi:hypothetical protein ACH4OW_27040 [Streptomyces sp. NPDC017056]|uniref:hypothetical protein n=1 Tax=Streptomyces sp. NPDC017056 TaxID=3364973 RepID=UPI0037BCD842